MVDKQLKNIPHSPNRVHMNVLASLWGKSEREARREIESYRMRGTLIASDGGGYFIPTSIEEIAAYYRRHRKRAITTLRSLKETRRFLKSSGIDLSQLEGRTGGKKEKS